MASSTLSSTLPPSLMSVPRPAMFVAMVIAPSLPASATICASCSCWRAFRTLCCSLALVSSVLSISDFSIEVVPTRTGCALFMRELDFLDDGLVFLARGAVDLVVLVDPRDGPVGRHLDHAKTVDLGEFLGLGRGGTGHAGQLVVEAEVILEGDRSERHVLRLDVRRLPWPRSPGADLSERRRPAIMRPVNSSISTTSSSRTM